MNCPNQKCRAKETRVKEVTVYKTFKYRIRFCPNCGTTFQTHEKIIEDSIVECNFEPLQKELPFFTTEEKKQK